MIEKRTVNCVYDPFVESAGIDKVHFGKLTFHQAEFHCFQFLKRIYALMVIFHAFQRR